MLSQAEEGAVFLLNSPFGKDEVWAKIPVEVQKQIIDKKLRFYVINGTKIADDVGLRGRINVTHADRLLPHLGHPPGGQGAGADQGCHRGHLRQQGHATSST